MMFEGSSWGALLVLEQSLAVGKCDWKSVLVESWRRGGRRDGEGLVLLLIVVGLVGLAPGWGLLL